MPHYLKVIIIIIILNKNLNIAWIDYQKEFDIVPHSWVEKSIELVGVNSKIVRFCWNRSNDLMHGGR